MLIGHFNQTSKRCFFTKTLQTDKLTRAHTITIHWNYFRNSKIFAHNSHFLRAGGSHVTSCCNSSCADPCELSAILSTPPYLHTSQLLPSVRPQMSSDNLLLSACKARDWNRNENEWQQLNRYFAAAFKVDLTTSASTCIHRKMKDVVWWEYRTQHVHLCSWDALFEEELFETWDWRLES